MIIPTLDEAPHIGDLIGQVFKSNPHEIIVVDGGSEDSTVRSAGEAGAKVISSPPGRGIQMNRAAAKASGEFLLFLHADTVPPSGYPGVARNVLNRPGTSAGAFRFRFADELGAAALIECLVNLRCRLLKTPYGDQGIFMRRTVFDHVGGFPEWPVAEDLEIIRKLRKLGKVRLTDAEATTSARSWKTQGLIRTFLRHQLVILGYHLNLPPSFLAGIGD